VLTGSTLTLDLRTDGTTTVQQLLTALDELTGFGATSPATSTDTIADPDPVTAGYVEDVNGQAAVAASGSFNFGSGTITVTSDATQTSDNDIQVIFNGGAASLTTAWDGDARILTVNFQSGATSLAQMRTAINSATTSDTDSSASLTASASGTTTQQPAISTTTLGGGVDTVAATAVVTLTDDETVTLSAQNTSGGAAFNTRTVQVIAGSAAGISLSGSAYTLTLVDDATTLATTGLISALAGVNMSAATYTGTSGDPLYSVTQTLTAASAGVDGSAALSAPGANNDIEMTAVPGEYNGYTFAYLGGGTAGSETVAVLDDSSRIEITIEFGFTTATQVIAALNAELSPLGFAGATLATGNDGSGVINPAPGTVALVPVLDDADYEDPRDLFLFDGSLHFVAENSSDEIRVWRYTSGSSAATAETGINLQADTEIRIFGDAIFYIEAVSLELMHYADAGSGFVAESKGVAPTEFALFAADEIALINASGIIMNLRLGDTNVVASRGLAWEILPQVIVHDGGLAVINSAPQNDSLWRIDGSVAENLLFTNTDVRLSGLHSLGDELFYVSTSIADIPTLYSLGNAPDDTSITRQVGADEGTFEHFHRTGDTAAYVYKGAGVHALRKVDLAASSPSSLVKNLGSSGSVSDSVMSDNGALFFILGNLRSTTLWRSDLSTNVTTQVKRGSESIFDPSRLTALGGQVYFLAQDEGVDGVLWLVEPLDGSTLIPQAKPLINFVNSVVPALNVYIANTAGDGLVNAQDGGLLAGATLVMSTSISGNRTLVDVTELIRSLLADGVTRVTFLLQLPATLAESVTLSHAHVNNGTDLKVTTGSSEAVTGSLYTKDGRLLQSGQGVIDMSQLTADTYFLRVEGPSDGISLNQDGEVDDIVDGPDLAAAGDYIYFSRDGALWRTNGIRTEAVNYYNSVDKEVLGISTTGLRLAGGAGNVLYFTLGSGATTTLWEVSGQFARKVPALNEEVLGGEAEDSAALGERLVIRVGNTLHLATVDGFTELKTYDSEVGTLTSAGNRVIYLVDGSLHATDGTVAGTVALDTIDAGVQSAGDIISMDGALYYLVEAAGSLTLWRAAPGEGQNFGAEPLKVVALAALVPASLVEPTSWSLLGVIDHMLLFTVTTADGVSLWASNGSGDPNLGGQTAGTAMIVEDLGGEAGFVAVNDDVLYFTVTNGDGTALWSSEGTAVTSGVFISELPGTITSRVSLNGDSYFIAGPPTTPILWKVTDAGVSLITFLPSRAAQLTAVGDRLAFTAKTLGVHGVGPSLWVSDGSAEGTRMVVDLTPIVPGTISNIAHSANGIVFTVRNDSAVVEGLVDYSLWISNGFADGTYPLISSNGGDWNFGTALNGPELLRVVGPIAFYVFNGEIISTDGTTEGTRVLATDIDPVQTLESDGRLVILDADGGMWISEGNLVGLSYRIEVKAPLQGNNHSDPDRDLLIGGEGEDILIGNSDHDQLFGNSGEDFFVGESSEIRDITATENFALPPTAEFSVQQPRQPDTEVYIPDEALRAVIAEALGIPVTVGFNGRPVIHGKIMASHLATLVELQAANRGIQSVVGLHFARNLAVLNLNGNRIGDLSILVPATDPVSGARTGLSNLRIFSLDYNGMGILTFNGDKGEGVGEYVDFNADINEIQSTISFWFRTDNFGQAMGLFSMDSGVRGSKGLDRSIFIDELGHIGAFMYDGADNGYEVIRSSGTNYADGTWHHVAYVFSADGAGVPQTLYVNGAAVAVGTATSSSLSIQDGFNLGFGRAIAATEGTGTTFNIAGGIPEAPGAIAYFKGDMDELRIWDTAFTDVQVRADMEQPYPVERVYLVGYWSFDGPSTNRVLDHSLHGRNGLLGGGNIDYAPAFNRMQPTQIVLDAEGKESIVAARALPNQLFATIIRDLQRLNVPGPIEKLSLAYTRIDVLDALSALPDLDYINLTGVLNDDASTLGNLVDHTATDAPSKLIEGKDGTRFVVENKNSLILSSGSSAWQRLTVGAGVDADESFSVQLLVVGGVHTLRVSAFEVSQDFLITHLFDAVTGLYDLQLVFEGGRGNDTLTIDGDFPITVYAIGGTGNDRLMGGHNKSYLFGGAGNDNLIVGSGYSELSGGTGDDVFTLNDLNDGWGSVIVNENLNAGADTIDFSNVEANLEINVRGISQTVGGLNTVSHLANVIERFIGGKGDDDIMNFHRDNGGVLELGNGSLVWDGVAITHSGIEGIDVRFVNSQDGGKRTGVVRVLAEQDYTGLERTLDLRLEARSIDIRASIKAGGLSLRADSIIGIKQDFSVASGLGSIILLEADQMRIEANGGVGDVSMPLYIRAGVIEAATQGAAGIYLAQLGDAIIGNVEFDVIGEDNIGSGTEGLSTGAGGNIHFFNLAGTLTVNAEIEATGGRIVLATEDIAINDTIRSVRMVGDQTFRGSLILQPLPVSTRIDMATSDTGAARTFHLSSDEIVFFMSGFNESEPSSYLVNGRLVTVDSNNGITIGRADGRHIITLDAFTYTESFTFRSPVPFGRFDVIGRLELSTSLVNGDQPALTFLGWKFNLS
jgi:ELWxxDGT repeat protein